MWAEEGVITASQNIQEDMSTERKLSTAKESKK
jgi:hypothetical protein